MMRRSAVGVGHGGGDFRDQLHEVFGIDFWEYMQWLSMSHRTLTGDAWGGGRSAAMCTDRHTDVCGHAFPHLLAWNFLADVCAGDGLLML